MYTDKPKNSMSRECLICGKVFSFHIARKDTAKYCSRKCHNESQKGTKAWNKGLTKAEYSKVKKEVVLNNFCLNCGKPVNNKYCNHSCQKIHRNKQLKGINFVELYGEEKAKEIQQKMSLGISKTAAKTHFSKIGAAILGEMRKGKTHAEIYGDKSKDIRKRLSEATKAFHLTPKGIKVRKAASERGIRLALSGKDFSNSKKGMYKNVYFGSSLEESFLKQVYRILGTLKNVERNTSKIVPKGSGFRKTAPDYLINDASGKLIAIIEVKSNHLMVKSEVYEKALALFMYGLDYNICTGYFTYDTLAVFEKFQGNPDPRRLKSLINHTEIELYNYIVSRKEQRLSVEDKDTNKTLKNTDWVNSIPNDPLPILEEDIVRYPVKAGVANV